jgi:DNA-binding Lrp family transcriptional regulator
MIKAIVLITILGGTGERLEWSKSTRDRVKEIPGVIDVYGVLGRYDLIALIEAETLERLTSMVADKIRAVPGIQTSETLTVAF